LPLSTSHFGENLINQKANMREDFSRGLMVSDLGKVSYIDLFLTGRITPLVTGKKIPNYHVSMMWLLAKWCQVLLNTQLV